MKNFKNKYSFIFLVALIILFSNMVYAQTGEEVRALWIFNIAPSVTWENEEDISKYTIGVFSSEKEFATLKKLAETRPINGKPVEVVKYENYEDVKPNHIVFVTNDKNKNLELIHNKLKGKNVLIISDRSKQPQYSVLNLNKVSAKQPFTINTRLYKTQRLKFSTSILRIGGDRAELKKIQAETYNRFLAEKKALENKRIEIAKTNKELIQAKRDLKFRDKEIEVLKEKLRKCEELK